LVAFLAEAAFGEVSFKDVQGKMTQDGHVLRAVSGAITGVVILKGDSQDPVAAIFDGPMRTRGF
jgi:hypothetical protein